MGKGLSQKDAAAMVEHIKKLERERDEAKKDLAALKSNQVPWEEIMVEEVESTRENMQRVIDGMKGESDRLRGCIARIQSACGIPDAAEACRVILKISNEALHVQRGKEEKA